MSAEQISQRALELVAKEAERLANNTGRPLSDEIYKIAAELRERGAEQDEADKEQKGKTDEQLERRKKSPLNRSGAKGSSWPQIQSHLEKLSLTKSKE